MKIWAAIGLAAVLTACGSSGASVSGGGASAAPRPTTTTVAGLCDGAVSDHVASARTFRPMTPGTLTVATSLPASGFWNGGDLDATKVNSGYEYELAKQLQHAFGLTSLKVRNVSSDDILDGHDKKFDVALSQLAVSCRETRTVQFSQPYLELSQGALVKSASKQPLKTAADVRRLRWAVSNETLAQDVLARFGANQPHGYDLLDDALTALNRGTVDAVLTDTGTALVEAQNSNGALHVAAQLGQPDGPSAFSAVLPSASTNLAAVNGVFRSLQRSTVLKQSAVRNLSADPSALRVIALPPTS
jgi:polar amino acid transport system substrate-binding protein